MVIGTLDKETTAVLQKREARKAQEAARSLNLPDGTSRGREVDLPADENRNHGSIECLTKSDTNNDDFSPSNSKGQQLSSSQNRLVLSKTALVSDMYAFCHSLSSLAECWFGLR